MRCYHKATTDSKSVVTDRAKEKSQRKCSLFRLQYPGIKIASYIILNENQSPLSGLKWKLTFLHASWVGKRHAEQRAPPTGKRPTVVQTNTQEPQREQHQEQQRISFRWPARVLLCAGWTPEETFFAIRRLTHDGFLSI